MSDLKTALTKGTVALGNGLALLADNPKHFPMPELNLFPLPASPQ